MAAEVDLARIPADADRPAPRVLVAGYNALDVTVAVTGLPAPDTKTQTPPIRLGGGGPAANAAVALARLGARVRLVTPLADDLPGQQQRRELAAAGVDLSLCPPAPGAHSPLAVILVDAAAGTRTVLWSRGDLPAMDPAAMEDAWLDDADLLLVDGHDPFATGRLARAARARGRPVVLDAGSVRDGTADLLAACTDVVAAAAFGPAFCGPSRPRDVLAELRARGPRRVAITFGAAGALGLDDDGLVTVPSFAVPVVDTTGAGDAFHAGYAWALARGAGFAACLEWGAAVAALKCGGWGCRGPLPDAAAAAALVAGGARRPAAIPD